MINQTRRAETKSDLREFAQSIWGDNFASELGGDGVQDNGNDAIMSFAVYPKSGNYFVSGHPGRWTVFNATTRKKVSSWTLVEEALIDADERNSTAKTTTADKSDPERVIGTVQHHSGSQMDITPGTFVYKGFGAGTLHVSEDRSESCTKMQAYDICDEEGLEFRRIDPLSGY